VKFVKKSRIRNLRVCHVAGESRRQTAGDGGRIICDCHDHRLKMAPPWTRWPYWPRSDRWSSGLSSRFTPSLICNWHCQLAGSLADSWSTFEFLATSISSSSATKSSLYFLLFWYFIRIIGFSKTKQQDKRLQDKRLFQCGSQEAGLVKYDKYTCKKWTVGL